MNTENQLDNRKQDYTASALKGVLGAVPIVGSALAEITSVIIPNQRMDRLVDFAKRLSSKLDAQEAVLIKARILEPEGTDILEEAMWQSARALSEERRQQIASVVKNGLSEDTIDLIETKKILQLLSQISDLELIILRTHASHGDGDAEFREKFRSATEPVAAYIGCSQEELDGYAMSEALRAHLVQLGLLRPSYPFLKRGELPEFDRNSGRFKNSGYEITLLGKLLLRSADFTPEN